MDDPKILDFQKRLQERLFVRKAEHAFLERTANGMGIVAEAVQKMHDCSISLEGIAAILEYAAQDLRKQDGDPPT